MTPPMAEGNTSWEDCLSQQEALGLGTYRKGCHQLLPSGPPSLGSLQSEHSGKPAGRRTRPGSCSRLELRSWVGSWKPDFHCRALVLAPHGQAPSSPPSPETRPSLQIPSSRQNSIFLTGPLAAESGLHRPGFHGHKSGNHF